MINNQLCILIVDDDDRFRRAVLDLFNAHNYKTLEASDGHEALQVFYAHNQHIDLILLDVMMPFSNGFEVLQSIRAVSCIPVIMLTAKDMEHNQLKGFQLGVDDYITKPFSTSLLLARVEAVARRSGKLISAPLEFGNLFFDTLKRQVSVDKVIIDLTQKEYELLSFLINHENITVSRNQILAAVWGMSYEKGVRTVDTHIKQLRSKLTSKCPYISTVHGIGYRFEVKK